MKLHFVLLIFLLGLNFSCKSEGEGAFSKLEETLESDDSEEAVVIDEEIEIVSFSPDEEEVVLLENTVKTFAIQLNDGVGDVSYTFKLDGVSLGESTNPFYELSSAGLDDGDHYFTVIATNSVSEASHTFNLRKNTKPQISLNSSDALSLNCTGDTFALSVSASDADGDDINYKFLLNNIENSNYLSSTVSGANASILFSPNCTLVGNNNITIRATDSAGEYSDYSVGVNVINPNIASIDSFSPQENPVVILSNEDQNFLVSATGTPPLAFEWDINPGSSIASCNNSTSCSVGGGDFSPGNYTLTVSVEDGIGTSDSKSFNLIINDKPQVSFYSPSNSDALKMNCNSNKNFQLTIEDENWSDGQNITVTWLLDGSPNPVLSSSTNVLAYPVVSDATFSPSCASSLIGDHKIKAIVNDGYESQEIEWDISINYFSEACNNLAAGEICTLAGLVGMGSGINVEDNFSELRIRPEYIESHPSGGFFFTDTLRHSVWFYNDSENTLTILGKEVGAKTVINMFGQTNYGLGQDGQAYNNYYLYSPRDLAYSASEDALYVADYGNHQVVRFNSSGQGYRWAGKSSGNTDGATRKSHKCNYPIGLDIDESEGKVFVACYGNTGGADGAFKYFLTNVDEGYTLIRYKGNTTTEGTIGYGGSARSPRAYSLVKDPNRRVIFAADLQKCRIMAVSYGDTDTYHGGSVIVLSNRMVRVTRGNGCGESFNKAWNNTGHKIRPYALEVYSDSGSAKGIFWSHTNRHMVGFVNISSSAISLGGRTFNPGFLNNVWGKYNTADYSRGEPAYLSTLAYNPVGLEVNGSTLLIADRQNGKIGRLDISATDGESDDLVGNLKVNDYDDESAKNANDRYFYLPRALEYSSSENSLLVYDHGNKRIRKIDLTTGLVTTKIGRGATGNADAMTEDPNDVYFRNVGDIQVNDSGSSLLYTDYHGGNGTNRNCQARLLNQADEVQTLFSQVIPVNKVQDIAGKYFLGCNTWNSATYNNQPATDVRLQYPVGIIADEERSELYIGDRSIHCIFQVGDDGVLKEHIGQCKSNGDISGDFSTAKFQNPGDFALDKSSDNQSGTNFFMVDRWITTNSYIKYVNTSATDVTLLGGVVIPSNQVAKIISTDGFSGGVAMFENQICYTQGANASGSNYPHNVICIDRNSGLTTLRVGKISASTVKAATPHYDEEEGVNASAASLSAPWGIAFDDDGNLYITSYTAHQIRMVKRWF